MERICALLEFTPKGYVEHHLQNHKEGIAESRLEGYGGPEGWKPCGGTRYPDGTPVLDKRPALEGGIGVLLRAPLLCLLAPSGDDAEIERIVELFSARGWNLRRCGLAEYIAHWSEGGAMAGHIMQGRIAWDVQERPAAS